MGSTNDACSFMWLVLMSSLSLAVAITPPFPIVNTTHPRFMAKIPKLKADWQKLATDPATAEWFDFLKRHANDDSIVPSPWLTRHAIVMFQLSGSASWAAVAWKSVLGNFINAYPNYDGSCCRTSWECCPSKSGEFYDGDNNARVIAGMWVDTYDWLYTALTPAQRAQFAAKLGNLFEFIFRGTGNCCSFKNYDSFPLRTTDQDVIVHNYFALLKYYVATADEFPHAKTMWSDPTYNLGGTSPKALSKPPDGVCGNNCYNASDLGIDMRTTVNAILIKYAAAGTGIASTGYNLEGEMNTVAIDWASLYSAYGKDYFPELPSYLLDWGMQYISLATPDYQWLMRWGDDESNNDPLGALFNDLGVVSATTSWFMTDPRQRYIRDFMKQILSRWQPSKKWFPYDQFFFAYGHIPGSLSSDFRPAFPAHAGNFSWDSYGTGTYRTGWTSQDSLLTFEFAPYSELDHFTQHVGNVQLYRKGEWSLYTPISYGSPGSDGTITNTMSFYGFPFGAEYVFIREFKGMMDVVFGPDFAFFVGANAGTHRYPGAWDSPPTWQQEYTRSVTYIPGSAVDIVLYFDRTNILDPKLAPKWNTSDSSWWTYHKDAAQRVRSSKRKTWQWHTHQQATINQTTNSITWKPARQVGDDDNGFAWRTSTTQLVTLKTHFTPTRFTSVAEVNLPHEDYFYWEGDQKTGFLVSEVPTTDRAFDATLHVVATRDTTAVFNSVQYVSSNCIAKSVLVSRTNGSNIWAAYNGQLGPSIPSPNCAAGPCAYVPTTATIVPKQHLFKPTDNFCFAAVAVTTPTLEVFLHDLNPASTYALTVDGVVKVAALPKASKGGFVHVTVLGVAVGARALGVLAAGGSCALPAAPAAGCGA